MSPIFIVLLFVAAASAQLEDLIPIDCGPNELFNSCGTLCPATCSDQTEGRECIDACNIGCECLPGYFRDEMTLACVPPEECSASLI